MAQSVLDDAEVRDALPPLEAGIDPGPLTRPTLERWLPYLFILPAILTVAGVFVYPIASGVRTSLYRSTLLRPDGPYVGGQNYAEIMTSDKFSNSMYLSVVFVVSSIVLGLAMALMFALVLYYMRFGASIARTISLVPWLVSGIAAAWVFKFFFNADVGLANRFTSLVGYDPATWLGDGRLALVVLVLLQTWSLVPFGTLILLGGLHMIDTEMYEAATMDGANALRTFIDITLPQLWPHIGVSLVILSYGAWNTFDIVMALTGGGPIQATELLAVLLYKYAFAALDFSKAAVVMVIILIINTGLSIFYLKSMPVD